MRIIHTADIHIDSPLTARLPRDKIKERRAELISNLRRLTDAAQRLGAEAIIIAGDLFDSQSVSKKAMSALIDAIESAPGISFFILPGNHDAEVLSGVGDLPKNLYLFPIGERLSYECSDGVVITGMAYCREKMFDEVRFEKSKTNIIVLHGELRDKSSAERESIGLAEAAGRGIDYIALGHYHSYSVHRIDDRGIAVYSGTPEGRGFDEAGECGFVLLDVKGGAVNHSFVRFAKRRLQIITVDLAGISRASEIADRAEAALRAVPKSDMVRLELCGKFIPGLWKDTASLTDRFRDRFYHFEVKDSSVISVDPADYKNDKSLKGEFIRTVYADPALDDEQKAKIVECGINALMGEGCK